VQSAQQWLWQRQQQQARVQGAQVALVASVRQLAALKAQRDGAEATLQQAIAPHDQASGYTATWRGWYCRRAVSRRC
jgi:hypothetical protein